MRITIGLLIAAASTYAATCDSLAALKLPNATITLAQEVPAGTFAPTPDAGQGGKGGFKEKGDFKGKGDKGGKGPVARFKELPAFCRVAATLAPTPDSDIKIEVWLPTSGWNKKFEAVGNGGWAGNISYPAMADALLAGYATASTDTGHVGPTASFAIDHPERVIDYGYRSVHELAVKGKVVITAFYGESPKYSYWNGCSTGGKQGLTEAQRYPEDFNGIVAGAPANYMIHLHAAQVAMAQAVHKTEGSFIPSEKFSLINNGALSIV